MILITGATGKVGTDLVNALVEQGAEVRALVRDPQRAARVLPEVVELSRGDLSDAESVKEALDGVERMFLLSPPDQRMRELELIAIAAAREVGVKHLVKLSAIGADPSATGFFLREHGHAEQAVRESGIPFTFL